jgi:hypothetical protein
LKEFLVRSGRDELYGRTYQRQRRPLKLPTHQLPTSKSFSLGVGNLEFGS